MCGRTACTLAPHQVCQACSLPSRKRGGNKNYSLPRWQDHPGSHTYSPSTNIAPSAFTPVLIKNALLKRDDGNKKCDNEYIVQPMMWGLLPSFYKGETHKGFGYKTSNCRIEDVEKKKLFLPSLTKGQRCVVLCDGFYEWQALKGSKSKQPYFIHALQPENVEIWNKKTWDSDELWNKEEGWKGAQILKMAGLYSFWKSTKGEEIYSYTVLTKEADDKFSSIHHRIPVLLETTEDVQSWLESGDYKNAISNLPTSVSVTFYPVSSLVNSVRNQEETVHAPISLEKEKAKKSGSSKLMESWLGSASKKAKIDKSLNEVNKKEIKDEKSEGKPKKIVKDEKDGE